MSLITIDQEKCIQCGICVAECPTIVLQMGEKGPEAVNPAQCVACGHCVAVCPSAAFDNALSPLAQQTNVVEDLIPDKETAKQFLRARRSIRTYRQTPVPREQLLQLVDMARLAPTGSNQQGISYIIVEDKKIMEKSSEIIIEWMEKNSVYKKFDVMLQAYRERGNDTILRGAPHLILALADEEFQRGRENAIFSLTYLELYAPALGLGSCWAGIFEICAFSGHKPLLELFNIPAGKKITGAVMAGYPQYRYQRLTDRNPLEVAFL